MIQWYKSCSGIVHGVRKAAAFTALVTATHTGGYGLSAGEKWASPAHSVHAASVCGQ